MLLMNLISQTKILCIGAIVFLILTSCGDDPEPSPIMSSIDPADRLPLIQIQTLGDSIVDEPKVSAEMLITQNADTLYNGHLGIEFRGATSQLFFPKKSYGIELWDENNEDVKASVFNMPEEEDWILHGPYSDKSLLRNKLIYDLSRSIDRYASRTEMVELLINGSELGTYIFMEKLKRDGERIDINKLKDDENEGEDVTGGYILKIDKTAGNNLGEGYNELNSFTSSFQPPNASANQSIYFLYEYPDAEDITEISNNVDGYRLSTYMHKDKNGLLTMGPIWDFNLAFGNADYCSGGATNVWSYKFNERCPMDFWLVPFWWDRLMQDPTFVTALQERWTSLRGGGFSTAEVHARMDEDLMKLRISGAQDQNFMIWNVIGTYIWPNNFVGTSIESETRYMKDWIADRMQWMDSAIMQL